MYGFQYSSRKLFPYESYLKRLIKALEKRATGQRLSGKLAYKWF